MKRRDEIRQVPWHFPLPCFSLSAGCADNLHCVCVCVYFRSACVSSLSNNSQTCVVDVTQATLQSPRCEGSSHTKRSDIFTQTTFNGHSHMPCVFLHSTTRRSPACFQSKSYLHNRYHIQMHMETQWWMLIWVATLRFKLAAWRKRSCFNSRESSM